MAPAASEKNMIGSVVDVCTSATISADGAIDAMSHAAPTDWISPPKFDARLEIHTARKSRWRMGASEERDSAGPVLSLGICTLIACNDDLPWMTRLAYARHPPWFRARRPRRSGGRGLPAFRAQQQHEQRARDRGPDDVIHRIPAALDQQFAG